MTYRVVSDTDGSIRIISPELPKRDAISCAQLLNKLHVLALVLPSSACSGFSHDLEGCKLANECRDMLRSTREFTPIEVQALLDECK